MIQKPRSPFDGLIHNSVYQKYVDASYSSLTESNILADLDAINSVSLETLPLIEFLQRLLRAKQEELNYTNLDSIESYNITRTYAQYTNDIPIPYRGTIGGTVNNLSSLAVHDVEHTLAGGALANAPLYQPGSGYQYAVFWFLMGSNFATLTQGYEIDMHEESGSSFFSFGIINSNMARQKIFVFDTGSADDKDFMIDIAGGDDTEHIFTRTVAGKFT